MEKIRKFLESAARDDSPAVLEAKRLTAAWAPPAGVRAALLEITPTPPDLAGYQSVLAFLLAEWPPGERGAVRVLDVGAFIGHFVALLRRLGFRAEGVDIHENHARIARDIGAEVRIGDARNLAALYPPAVFDVVVCVNFFHHHYDFGFPPEDVLAVFRGVAGVLAPGGCFLAGAEADFPIPLDEIETMGLRNLLEPARLLSYQMGGGDYFCFMKKG
jgi:SAM-dependent methyltransferase